MTFKPVTSGDFEHYEYAGSAQDIAAGFAGEGNFPTRPVTDAAGNLYVAGDGYIEQYDPAVPSAPICSFELGTGGITAITVNPLTGAVFYYTYKNKRVHQLTACDGTGHFTEPDPTGVALTPQRDDLYAMAFDPIAQVGSRDPGTLYAAAPGPVPVTGGKGEPGQSALGYVFAPVEEHPPTIEDENVVDVTASSASLRANINPEGAQTQYTFQYISDAGFLANGGAFTGPATSNEAPAGGALLGGGQAVLAAGATIAGLEAATEYHFRIVASSHCSPSEPTKVCETVGSGHTFRTFPQSSGVLPDRRAYELVSPPQKNGGQVFPAEPNVNSCASFTECKPGASYQHFPMQSAPGGDAVVYEGSSFTPGLGAAIENEYLANRTADGWSTTNLTPPLLLSKAAKGYKAFDTHLTQGILEQTRPSLNPQAPPAFTNLYLQPARSPNDLQSLLTESPLNYRVPLNRVAGTGSNHLALSFAGASSDFSRQFFEANDALTEVSATAPVANDGGEEKTNLYEWRDGQLRLVNVQPGNKETIPGAAFGSGIQLKSGTENIRVADYSHAISADGARVFWSSESGQVYVRENGEQTRGIPDAGKFLTASADGSVVLLSNGHMFDLDSEAITDVTEGSSGFQGILGHSDDLERIYFVDTAVLDGTPNSAGQSATAGSNNVYLWSGGAARFVASLPSSDSQDWEAAPALRMAEASPDGRWVAFLSTVSLTGYDNVGPCKVVSGTDEFLDAPCSEVFLYSALTDTLTCVSCNPSGTRPLGPSVLRLILNVKGSLPQPRYLTNEGRLFFDSQDSLAPSDTNNGAEDVYQFEPSGVGSCDRPGGCIALISGGRSAFDSNFLAMDDLGANVFFTTRDALVPADRDELVDLYDARVDGGLPSDLAVSPAECKGEACQPARPAPVEPSPNSSGGPSGNVSPDKSCRKGQVRRNGRCVKKSKRKKRSSQTGKRQHRGAK
jgi:hypothetical protein